MEKGELKEYLKSVYILEQQIYTYQNSKYAYKKKISELDQVPVVQNFTEEQAEEWKKTERYKQLEAERNKRYNKQFRFQLFLIKFIWIAYVVAALAIAIGAGSDFLVPFVGLLAFAIPLTSVVNHVYEPANKKFAREEDAIMNRYFLELAQKEVHDTVRSNNPPMIARLQKECDESIIIPQQQAETLLKQLYDMNVIHTKYRSLLVVAQLYEYLDTGRCSELEGPYGAYNLYESELRQNLIINRLDQVINSLQALNRTMYYATNALMESNQRVAQISREMEGIKENTSLIAYASNALAEDSRIAMKYHLHLTNR